MLWLVISLALLFSILVQIQFAHFNDLDKKTDPNYDRVKSMIDYTVVPLWIFATTAHWIFSSRYLEMVLAGALILNPTQGDLDQK